MKRQYREGGKPISEQVVNSLLRRDFAALAIEPSRSLMWKETSSVSSSTMRPKLRGSSISFSVANSPTKLRSALVPKPELERKRRDLGATLRGGRVVSLNRAALL